ncbi:MAG: AMP-binding protein [Burkholderiales bacterium]|nr:AMP-binding protein [Burkholderiales bacterium]
MDALRSTELAGEPWGLSDATVGELLAARAASDGDFPYCREGGRTVTVAELDRESNRVANALAQLGARKGDRVALMLANSVEHFILFFALAKLGACNVSVNVHLRGDSLAHVLRDADPALVVADAEHGDELAALLPSLAVRSVIWRNPRDGLAGVDFASLLAHGIADAIPAQVRPEDMTAIIYTSGTTGMPKGVMLTDKMLRVSAWAAARECAARDGDVLHMWEPLYHIGGAEVLILAVQKRVTLALVPRLRVSRLWAEAREYGATHIHFLGGILGLLLAQPARPDDRDHCVRVAWGGGCPEHVWKAFEERFGVQIHDAYGMTECSSFATQNLDGVAGSIGKALPYLDLTIVGEDGSALGPDQPGEIRMREKVPGILTAGYWRNPEATAEVLRDGELRTGDLACVDRHGYFRYLGRKKDSVRRRGENISAAEVEQVLDEHPDVVESAVIGVRNDLADEDVKAVIRPRPGAALDALALVKWCEGRLAYFQVPRFVEFVEDFPRTPSQRVRKEALSRDTGNCWDLERSGYELKRQR